MPKYQKPVLNFNADDVWGAACAAQRINGSYIKLSMISESDPAINQQSNRQIVEGLLADTFNISDEDREQGKKVRKYFQGFTFKILQGKALSEFNNTAMLISNRDVITSSYDVAVIASLPNTYQKSIERDNVDRRINFARGGYLGVIGDKFSTEIEVVKQIWSQNWNTYYITGITDEDNVVFFASKVNIEIGDRVKIQGTIKAHRDNSTQLNRVKVI
jgi:hypothetical protein